MARENLNKNTDSYDVCFDKANDNFIELYNNTVSNSEQIENLNTSVKAFGTVYLASQSTGQSVSSGIETDLIFANTDNKYFNITSGTIKFKEAGVYLIIARLFVSATTPDGTNLRLKSYRNSVALAEDSLKNVVMPGDSWCVYMLNSFDTFAVNDTFRVTFKHNAASAINTQWSTLRIAYIGNGGV